jgi:luciferase family oxidoreductase group 1
MDLSVLDLAFVGEGVAPSQALAGALDLAAHVDRLGFRRYWVAEHHNMPSVASSAPDVILARVGAATRRIRLGSGGVMLPNHAPLMVAERFKTLGAFFPDRVDLGLGRAPGTDQVTSWALRRLQAGNEEDVFLDRLQELIAWEFGGFPKDHPVSRVRPEPSDVPLPPIFLLGSSDFSAQLAGEMGFGYSFAHHFATHDAASSMLDYRRRFKASRWRDRPHAILATSVVAAESDEEAERLAAGPDLAALRRSRGVFAPLPSPETAALQDYSDAERAFIRANRKRLIVGSIARVRERLARLAEETQADELMIACPIYEPAARKACFGLLAQAFNLSPA